MNKEAVEIIGGADGPTSVYIAGRKKRVPIKHRIRNRIYKWKSKRAAKQIVPGARTIPEVVAYAVKKYGAIEADKKERLGEAEEFPMDFHIYEIRIDGGRLEMEIDDHRNVFSVSYSGRKKSMKRLKEIARDLYLYYGVSEEDILQKSERYHSLRAMLSI